MKPAMITTLLLVMGARLSAPWSVDSHVMAQDHKAVIQTVEMASWPATRPATTATRLMTMAAAAAAPLSPDGTAPAQHADNLGATKCAATTSKLPARDATMATPMPLTGAQTLAQ
jgi:hypothetical protein